MISARALVCDAYGTLLDVHGPARRLADRLGPDAQAVSAAWRRKQLEYSWIQSLADHYVDFSELTEAALRVTLRAHGIDEAIVPDLLAENLRLDAYPEVAGVLPRLGVARAVLSNGTPASLAKQLAAAGIAELFDAVLSADAVRVFKPDARVYRLATELFACSAGDLAFLSSNPWDAFGAREFGFQVVWVNREAKPDEYGLRGTVDEISDLSALPALLA